MFSPEDDSLKDALLKVYSILKRRVQKIVSVLENSDSMIVVAALIVLLLITFDR